MLYKERLAEIQDDMIPFGFIDDGEETATPGVGDGEGNVWFEQKWKGHQY